MSAWLLRPGPEEPPGVVLRRLLEREPVVVAPGVFNALSAVVARRAGFTALYVSGAAFSASLALPDLGLFTLTELADFVRRVYRACGLPLVVDADTGFGEALNVLAAVRELEWAGAAAIQLEDQPLPKKCGHLSGKSVVPSEEMARKVAAAASARRHALIVARTDARAVEGLDGAVRRALLYREAGADILFPEALESEAEFAEFARRVGGWLLANMTEFGRSPYLTAQRFAELGYRVVIFPVTALRAAMKAAEEVLEVLRRDGTQVAVLDRLQTRAELYDRIGYAAYEEWDAELAQRFREGGQG
ncbi:MAG: methylisocitrate lyase [Armatimonadota bacterium]|nr:methylisocitrate lyase [Armatimonadota bacterium]MDR5676717.1 methylisocitrate lyase [Armatimonadota bacterium]MDR5688787.1 methylisocitrate lyase [Armatimonadota bacterium]MDR7385892.1 methylisocitrate lyase [Armatimonadota bacterium]MDR7388925.1 methylisocitrate lyase [Armatimonadota bacterium]